MILKNIFSRKNEKKNESLFPDWVSDKNITLAAYNYINQLKLDKLEFIAKHNKVNDYKSKGSYQITAAEVARQVKAATTTLISTSAYSKALKEFLDNINSELNNSKELKLSKHKRTLSAGLKQHKKDEIRIELQNTKIELDSLKKRNAVEQAKVVLESLSLPIKQKLGID